jgi:hypothetical protein
MLGWLPRADLGRQLPFFLRGLTWVNFQVELEDACASIDCSQY